MYSSVRKQVEEHLQFLDDVVEQCSVEIDRYADAEEADIFTSAAFSRIIENCYTYAEKCLKFLADASGETPPGDSWHREIVTWAEHLEAAGRRVFTPALIDQLDELRQARHFFRYGSVTTFLWDQIRPLVDELKEFRTEFARQVRELLDSNP